MMGWEGTRRSTTPSTAFTTSAGLYKQSHRREEDIYGNLAYLFERRHGARLPIRNVPNRYLTPNANEAWLLKQRFVASPSHCPASKRARIASRSQ